MILKSNIQIFSTAFLQVMFVSMQGVFIPHGMIIPMLLTGFMISIVWCLNIKKLSIGNWKDRLIYSTGAVLGTGAGYYLAQFIKTLI